MNAQSKIEPAAPTLELLRAPFPKHQVSKLPKETKAQREAREKDRSLMVWKCEQCGGAHHKQAQHLDYVGHAALTDRLLDVDPTWDWQPVAWADNGLPLFDQSGGLWIKLTVLGTTRLGYGHAAAKSQMDPGAREKEVIGDALRNAAIRFGAALDLWHKGDLHVSDEGEETPPAKRDNNRDNSRSNDTPPALIDDGQWALLQQLLEKTRSDVRRFCKNYSINSLRELPAAAFADAKDKLDRKLAKQVEAEKAAQQASQNAPSDEFAGATDNCPF